MATVRNIASNARCLTCHRRLINSFISNFTTTQRNGAQPVSLPQRPIRAFSRNTTSPFYAYQGRSKPVNADDAENDLGNDRDIEDGATQDTDGKDELPWYLQDQSSDLESNPFAERQKLPELPQNPPPILEPLLNHVSIDLGLDYLSFLDLRGIDPPPAFGTNLIMLFGSARSEKHLNVSADRLCRWLRSNYKLRPLADGLLGRNELKLKLRRKNRRAKMLGAAGAVPSAQTLANDDGIHTGWICVNVGSVPNGPETEAAAPDFVGFGPQSNDAQLVVQIMTEDKRGSVDLEGLWEGVLRRFTKKQERDLAAIQQELGSHNSEDGIENVRQPSATERNTQSHDLKGDETVATHPIHPSRHVTVNTQQVRRYHHHATLRSKQYMEQVPIDETELDELELEPRLLLREESLKTRTEAHFSSILPRPPEKTESHDLAGKGSKPSLDLFDDVSKGVAVNALLEYLKDLSKPVACEVLGKGEHDKDSTTFLKSFWDNIPVFPESFHYQSMIELQCQALLFRHPGYTKHHLIRLLNTMSRSVVPISEEVFLLVFETILKAPHALDATSFASKSGRDGLNAFKRSLGWSLQVLERMESHGHPIATMRIIVLLHEASLNPTFLLYSEQTPTALKESSVRLVQNPQSGLSYNHSRSRYRVLQTPPTELIFTPADREKHAYHVLRAVDALYPQSIGEPLRNRVVPDALYLRLFADYISLAMWGAFWNLWHHLARLGRPRTADMYAMLFKGVAATGDAEKCREIAALCGEEMGREAIPVGNEEEVRVALEQCLAVAEDRQDVDVVD